MIIYLKVFSNQGINNRKYILSFHFHFNLAGNTNQSHSPHLGCIYHWEMTTFKKRIQPSTFRSLKWLVYIFISNHSTKTHQWLHLKNCVFLGSCWDDAMFLGSSQWFWWAHYCVCSFLFQSQSVSFSDICPRSL